MSWDKWVKERGTDPPTFCPIDGENVIVGMNYIANEPPRGKPCVGEFWYDDVNRLHVDFYVEES